MSERFSWRELPPVPEADRLEAPDKVSQTLLSRQSVCPRSAWLYHLHRGGPGSHEMHRGSAFHDFARQAIELLVERDESQMPPEVAKDLMQGVIDDPQWTISTAEADRLRVMSHHFAEGFVVDPASVVAVEQMFELELGGVTLRGKTDLVLAIDDGLAIRDWKSSFNLPAQDEFEADFQVPAYAVLLAFGRPEGEMPLGDRAQIFDLGHLYPMYLWDDGPVRQVAYRQAFLTRAELSDHRAYLEGLVGKLVGQFGSGEWPATPGSHCSTCSLPSECPLPPALRGYSGEAPEALAERVLFLEPELKADKKLLRALASASGPVRVGDVEFGFTEQESRETDWEGLEEAVDRAVSYGEPFVLEDFRKVRRSTRFGARKVKPDEAA